MALMSGSRANGWWVVAMSLLVAGCGGSGDDDAAADGGVAIDGAVQRSFVTITLPAAAATFTRTQAAANGTKVAPIMFASEASADVASVEYLAEDVFSLGAADAPTFALTYPFSGDGMRWVVAHARDAAGVEVATARVDFIVKAEMGQVGTCKERLTALGVTYTVGPANRGVADPVTVTTPINGLTYFAYGATTPQARMFMDCTLALALHKMAEVSKPRGVTAVEHIGIYNYRCIGGGDPDVDNCTPSQHAYAKAIDIHELRDAQGTTYNTETDWIIDPDTQQTCSAPTAGVKDAFLHEMACLWNAQRVFAIILTPNYNAAHDNHFHVDLTAGAHFIGSADPRGTPLVEPPYFGPAPYAD